MLNPAVIGDKRYQASYQASSDTAVQTKRPFCISQYHKSRTSLFNSSYWSLLIWQPTAQFPIPLHWQDKFGLGRQRGAAQAVKAVPWSGRNAALSCHIRSSIDWLQEYSAQTPSDRKWISNIEVLSTEIKGKAVKHLGLQKHLTKLSPKQQQKKNHSNSATKHLDTQHS